MKKLLSLIIVTMLLLLSVHNLKAQCNVPSLQPTNLILTANTNSVTGSFTASASADHYLIVRSTTGILSVLPANSTTYSIGDLLGEDTVVSYQTDTSFTNNGLSLNVLYYYFVFAANSNCTGGPIYLTTSPCTKSVITGRALYVTAILQEYYNEGTGLMNQTQDVDSNGNAFNKWPGSVVDTLTMLIRSTTPPNYVIESGYTDLNLNPDGTIIPISLASGHWNLCPWGTITGYHYIVIKHRNSIETWSDSVDFSGQQINYNFFTHTPVQFSGGMYEDESGNFEIWGGDVTNGNDDVIGELDGYITLDDVFAVYDAELDLVSGYNLLDIDGDGFVTLNDVFLVYDNQLVLAQTVNPVTPPTQPTDLTLNPNFSTVTGSFTASGTADHYLIVRSTSSTFSTSPVSGTTYIADSSLGDGIVVAYQIGTSFTDTSLNYGTYYYYIYAADSLGCGPDYLTLYPLTASVFLNCGIPITQPTALSLTRSNTTVNGYYTASASADHYLIVRSTSDTLTAAPVSGTTYTTGTSLGGGTVVAYQTGTSFADSNLNLCTQYYYFVFAANCTGSPQYLSTNSLTSFTKWHSSVDIMTFQDTTYFVNSNITWVGVNPSNDTCSILFGINPGLVNLIDTVYMYTDACDTLTLINTYAINDSIAELYLTDINAGTNYYFEVEFNNVLNNLFSATIISNNKKGIPCNEICNMVKDGNFECIDSLNLDTNNTSPFYFNYVPGWNLGWGTPNIENNTDVTGLNYHYSAYLWGYYIAASDEDIGEGVYQDLSLNPNFVSGVQYELTFDYYKPTNNNSPPTGLSVYLANFQLSYTNTMPLFSNTTKILYYGVIYYDNLWHHSNTITFTYPHTTPLPQPTYLTFFPISAEDSVPTALKVDIMIDNVVIKPKVKFIASSLDTICLGNIDTITAFVPTINYIASWQWKVSGNIIASGTNSTPRIIVSPTVNTIYTVIITDTNGCQYTGIDTLTVESPTAAQFNLPSPYTLCSGQSDTIVASVQGGITISNCQWTSIPAGTYGTASSIIVSPTTNTTYYVIATDKYTCQHTDSITINVTPVVPVQFNHTSPFLLCTGGTVTITASVSGFTSGVCQWSSTPPGTYGNTQSITVTPTANNSTYTVVTDANGCETSGTFVVNMAPPTPITITQTWTSGCPPQVSFSVPNYDNITYIWYLPTGATITSYPTDSSAITVNWNNAGYDTISVDCKNINGCIVYQGFLLANPNSCVNGATQLNSLTTSQIIATLGFNGTNNNTNNIIFNGVTTIDQDLTFTNCPNLMLGSNARINVMPNVTLTFDNCTLKQTCNCHWNGIYAESPTSKIVLDSCTVRDAQNAVVSNNGGNYHITYTQFINDSLSLWVHNYNPSWLYDIHGKKVAPAAHPGYLASSSITQNGSLPGYYSTTHLTGIIVDTVYNLMIGDTLDKSQMNYFSYLQWGIKTKKSQVYIYNNELDSIYYIYNSPSYNGSEPNEAAIFCKTEIDTSQVYNPPSMPLINEVTIGDGTTYTDTKWNRMDDCNTGIYSYNTQMNVINNWVIQTINNSIRLENFNSPSVINYNTTTRKTGTYNATNNLYNFDIVAEQPNTNANVILDINNNQVVANGNNDELYSGILLRNCNGTRFGNSHCIIQNNQFLFQTVTPSTNYYYGISVSNCNYAKITDNTFISDVIPDMTYDQKLIGMYLYATQNANVSENKLINMGDGIYVSGTSLGSQYSCNEFDNCWDGFFLSLATLSNQMINHTATDNYWYDIPPVSNTSALRRLTGNSISIVHLNWYHRGSTTDSTNVYSPYLTNMNPLSLYITPFQNITVSNCSVKSQFSTLLSLNTSLNETIDTTTSTIEQDTLSTNATERDQLMGEIVKDSISFQNFEQENKYMAKEFAYKLLDETPAYMNLGTNDDTIYQYFYDTVNNSNSGNFYQTSKYINDQNYSAASNLNLTITGTNTIENNRIAVNSIYLNKVVNNQFLGESDSLTLVDIAYQLPITGGDAVISARVILGIDPFIDSSSVEKSVKQQANTIITPPLTIKVYPNPANDKLYVVLDNAMVGMAKIEIYDINGKLSYTTNINTEQKLQTLNVSSIKAGMYNLRITTTNQTFNQKLVIIK